MPNKTILVLSGLALAASASISRAESTDCPAITDDAQRLACYDRQFRTSPAAAAVATANAAPTAGRTADLKPPVAASASKMSDDWDLSEDNTHSTFEIRKYKPVYILLGTHTNDINRQPQSANPTNSVGSPLPGLLSNEAQFQLSFKTKVWENVFGSRGNLWVGYTQSSRWQVYSGGISRPFRETNYEPEAMLMFPTTSSFAGWDWRVAGIGINHQSNGRANPLSRSWNRIVGHLGAERGDTSLQIRPWIRIKEHAEDDNNPGIENYVGRAEVIVAQRLGEHVLSLQGRHSLRFGENSRGSVKIDWAIPISGHLKGHLSVFSGYGESMIDYNHRQTMFGAGISLVEW